MMKTLLLVLAGLGAGLAIAFSLQPSWQPAATSPEPAAVSMLPVRAAASDGLSDRRLAELETALDAEIAQRAALEARVRELAAELAARLEAVEQNREAPSDRPPFEAFGPSAGGPDPIRMRARREGLTPEQAERRIVEQLISAGFAPDRAEWINGRMEELRLETLQAQYDARREGRPFDPQPNDGALRTELGDADYERYLNALGRPASVGVRQVLASSPAERSGLKAGDEIVAYGGKRVFDLMELNQLTLEGTPGESIVVDVRRDGQTVQLVMPRGPLGIYGGFRGR